MKKRDYKTSHGFTLLEIIIAISLTSLILVAVTGIYHLSQKTYNEMSNKAEIVQNGRVILDRLSRELRQTQEIVTILPPDNSDPALTPNEILFQNGHNTETITYIKYYLNGSDIYRQKIIYYFSAYPDTYVLWNQIDQYGESATMEIIENKLIGEYVDDLEFWADNIINIKLQLFKGSQSTSLFTKIYARNSQ